MPIKLEILLDIPSQVAGINCAKSPKCIATCLRGRTITTHAATSATKG